MIDKNAISNPKTHYGDGKHATRDFLIQRITGALNVAFTAFFVWFVLRLAGADRAEMLDVLHDHPAVGIVLALLIVNVCIHMRIGMNEVIEDYLSDERTNRLVRFANSVFAILVALATVVAIAKLMFWG